MPRLPAFATLAAGLLLTVLPAPLHAQGCANGTDTCWKRDVLRTNLLGGGVSNAAAASIGN